MAVEREIREETGLSVANVRPVGVVEQTFYVTDLPGAATGHMAVFTAEAETATFGDDLGETDDEIEDAAWFDDLPERINGLSHELLHRLIAEY